MSRSRSPASRSAAALAPSKSSPAEAGAQVPQQDAAKQPLFADACGGPYTTLDTTPVSREKPYLYVDAKGRYQVRVTAAGETKTQDVEIRRNTAVPGVTDADLQAQFDLAMRISERVSEANRAVIRIRDIKEQITDRIGKASDGAIKTAGQALIEKLTEVEGEIYQHRLRSGQDPLNYPIRLNNKLAALQGTVESGDYPPTDQARAVFKELSGRLDQQLARLDALVKTDVAALSRSLEAAGLAPITSTD